MTYVFPSDVVRAVWDALRRGRDFAHPNACPTSAKRAELMLAGAVPPRGCEPCYDMLVDALLHVGNSYERADDPAAYAFRSTRNHLTNMLRSANAAGCGVARPERRDGVVGHVRAALARGPEPRWSDELLTLALQAASARRPLPAGLWPFEEFTAAKTRHLGRAVTSAEVRSDLAHVLDVLTTVAGPEWVHRYVTAAMIARTGEFASDVDSVDLAGRTDQDLQQVALERAFWRQLAGTDPTTAVRAAVAELGGPIVRTRDAQACAVQYLATATFEHREGKVLGLAPAQVRVAISARCPDAVLPTPLLAAVAALLSRLGTGRAA